MSISYVGKTSRKNKSKTNKRIVKLLDLYRNEIGSGKYSDFCADLESILRETESLNNPIDFAKPKQQRTENIVWTEKLLNFFESIYSKNQNSAFPARRDVFMNLSQEIWHELETIFNSEGAMKVFKEMGLRCVGGNACYGKERMVGAQEQD